MKLLPAISTAFLAAGLLFSLNAQSVTTDPVGYVTTTFFGDRDTTFAPGLTRPGVFRGNITSTPDLSSLSFSGQSWATDEFADSHFVLVRSGELEGAFAQISSNTSDTLTLTFISEDFFLGSSQGVNAGDNVEIIPFWTLGELFSDNVPDGSRVLLFSRNSVGEDISSSQGFTFFEGFGWFSGSTPGNDVVIFPDESIIFRNITGEDYDNIHLGQVRIAKLRVRFDLLDAMVNQDIRIPSFNVSGRPISQIFDGNNLSTGDRLLIFDNSAPGVDKSASLSATFFEGFGWFSGSTDLNNYILPENAGLVFRKSRDGNTSVVKVIQSEIIN